MNKSEIERGNMRAIIDSMPPAEKALCQKMILSLLASVGHPVTGRTFMMAVAAVNVEIACNSIRLGVVGPNGEDTPNYPTTVAAENATLSFIGATTADEYSETNYLEKVELRAKEIYESWHAKDGFIKWVAGGNSIMQDEARTKARKEIIEGPLESAPKFHEGGFVTRANIIPSLGPILFSGSEMVLPKPIGIAECCFCHSKEHASFQCDDPDGL